MASSMRLSPVPGLQRRPLNPTDVPQVTPNVSTAFQASPATQAMGGPGTMAPRPLGGAPSAPGAAPNGSLPGTAPRTDLVTPPTVDTSGSEQAYNDALANNNKMIGEQRTYGENYLNSLQRRNGTNAALTGMSMGGGSYLGGQRAAFTTGINALNQSLLPFQQNATNIFNAKAGTLGNAAGANASMANSANQFNAGREGNIQDRTADAEAENLGKNISTDLGSVQTSLSSSYGIDLAGGHGATWALGRQLTDAVSKAPAGSAEQKAAMARVQGYQSKLASAKAQYNSGGGKGGNFVFGGKSYSNISLDKYLALMEQEGYFNGL